MKAKFKIVLFVWFVCFHLISQAQHSSPDTIQAIYIQKKINFDGNLSDSVWQNAPFISNFTQRELNVGVSSTERTKVAIAYDNLALYIGVWCYQSSKKITAKFLQRDFDYDTEDNFEVIISPFNDKRNGYLFVINPLGARADLLVSGQESSNINWNGVWDAKTQNTEEGWFAEIYIPFNTLQFRKDSVQTWDINFERNIRYKNEQVLWQGWNRNYELENLAQAGTLSGLNKIGYAKRFELKPYGLGNFNNNINEKFSFTGKLGGDLNIILSPTLKLNLTANTDFAQVEADRIAVNLSRFNLFYPEKREFFLDGYQNFQFSLGNSNEVFYTRRIGLENFKSVPIIAGARLFGKIGGNNIGVLNIQTGSKENISPTNNTVVRYKRDIGSQSYIGGIFTNKSNAKVSNQVAGIDGLYSISNFLKNKNLLVGALLAQSFDKQLAEKGNLAWRFYIDYPNDLIDHFIGVSGIGENFNPSIGFLSRKNFESLTWNFRFTPRWFTKYGIRKMYFRPWGFTAYRTATTGDLESFDNESRPFGFFTKSGERFEYNLIQKYDRVDVPFNISDSINIPAGKYWMYRQEIQAGSFQGRRLWIDGSYAWGGFYGGRIKTIEASLGINVSRHLNLRTDYIRNDIFLFLHSLSSNELAEYVNYAFTPNLDLAFFIQWNSLDDFMLGNFRLHWIPKPGSDLFVVYNRGYTKLDSFKFADPSSSTGAAKIVWRFVF